MSQNDVGKPLEGKLVLITGASRGIGRAVAIAAARAGGEIIITGRTIGALEEVDDEIKAAGGKATIVEMDMKDFAAMPRLAAAIQGRWGRLDGLVANAGMLPALTPVSHVQPDHWDESIAVNLTGQWHLIRSMDALLRAAPAGGRYWCRRGRRLAVVPSGHLMRRQKPVLRLLAGHGQARASTQICGSIS